MSLVYICPPPENAVVFCIDEKSSIQALDRTQPGLPMKPGRCGTMTHDYKRNGASTLFTALNTLTGEVIGKCQQRHTHKEFLSFLRTVEKQTPKTFALYPDKLILVEFGGNIFWVVNGKTIAPRRIYLGKRIGENHHGIYWQPQ